MNEEYLWDKSGEPDPEIKELEQILGTLRSKPKPFALPENVQARRRSFLPLVAMAATILIALLAGLAWLNLRPAQKHEVKVETPSVPVAPVNTLAPAPPEQKKPEEVAKTLLPAPRRQTVAVNESRRNKLAVAGPSKEALMAKEQLLTALRLASEKLNFAQRKTQNPSPNQIRNQHKLG